jgi:hypothetical protein
MSAVESGHYRFSHAASPPLPIPAVVWKSPTRKHVKSLAMEPCGAFAHRGRPCVQRSMSFDPTAGPRQLVAGFLATKLSTPIVLGHPAADFSTDAGNSALIAPTKSPRRLVPPNFGYGRRRRKTRNEIFI